MYLKNFFKSRKAHVAGVVVPIAAGLTVGLYNMYILGRCDQINETIELAETALNEGRVLNYKSYDKSTVTSVFVKIAEPENRN